MNNPQRTIIATWLAMLALQSVGSVDSKHRLPAPRQFVAIGALWGILFLVADTGRAKLAARFSMLLLLTATVIGPFGLRVIRLLTQVARRFAIQPPAQQSAPAAIGPQRQTLPA